MLKKILNIGVSETNKEILNRKIRFSNFITLLSLISMIAFVPVAIYVQHPDAIYLLFFFASTSSLNLVLHYYKKHSAAFYCFIVSGYIYFTSNILGFGLISNMQYFMLVMCMISIVLFDNTIIIKISITIAITLFFFLESYMKNKTGFINLSAHFHNFEEFVGHIIMLLVFIITCAFFIFFKNENLNFQKSILLQKELIEEKNKDITASITYAKKIQQSIMPSEKYIDKNIKRLKKRSA